MSSLVLLFSGLFYDPCWSVSGARAETILFTAASVPELSGSCAFSKCLLNGIDCKFQREEETGLDWYIASMCQVLG